MKGHEIYSKAWCDMLFEGRNRAYGAYVLRRDAGHRYAVVFRWLGFVFLLFVAAAIALGFYVYSQVKEVMAELDQVTKLERLEPEKDHEFKQVAQGRHFAPNMRPGQSMSRPEIVDGLVFTLPLGNNGPESMVQMEDELLLLDQDTLQGQLPDDLPEEGLHLTPTEVVEEMPLFPGGIGALMKWLDEHIIYNHASVRAKVEGDMEVTFIVDSEGHVRDARVTKPLNSSLDRMVAATIMQMPKWVPAKKNGQLTNVQITLPIRFELN